MIELGSKAKDTISGYTGIATARYEYMNGCVRYELSGTDKEGRPLSYVFDVQQIEVLEAPKVKKPRHRATGGPRDNTPLRIHGTPTDSLIS